MYLIDDIRESRAFRKMGGRRPAYYNFVFQTIKKNAISGLWMEFGVSHGKSLRHLSKHAPVYVYGFDSFEGLPEEFYDGKDVYPKGAFGLTNPDLELGEIEGALKNVRLIKGMFQDTLIPFLNAHDQMCSVIHIDCDLYSSTSYVLNALYHRITVGTYILFDEIHSEDENLLAHEHKAFVEFLDYTGYKADWVAYVENAPQATCRIISGT